MAKYSMNQNVDLTYIPGRPVLAGTYDDRLKYLPIFQPMGRLLPWCSVLIRARSTRVILIFPDLDSLAASPPHVFALQRCKLGVHEAS